MPSWGDSRGGEHLSSATWNSGLVGRDWPPPPLDGRLRSCPAGRRTCPRLCLLSLQGLPEGSSSVLPAPTTGLSPSSAFCWLGSPGLSPCPTAAWLPSLRGLLHWTGLGSRATRQRARLLLPRPQQMTAREDWPEATSALGLSRVTLPEAGPPGGSPPPSQASSPEPVEELGAGGGYRRRLGASTREGAWGLLSRSEDPSSGVCF